MCSSHRHCHGLPTTPAGLTFGLLLTISAASCGGNDPPQEALDITLVPNHNLNSVSTLLDSVHVLHILLDSEEGLFPPDSQPVGGDMQLVDVDDDGKLEVTADAPVTGDELPTFRLLRGGLSDVPLDIQVDGLPGIGEEAVATGGLSGVRFAANDVVDLSVQFNLLNEYLPPRVTQIFPDAGEETGVCLDAAVTVRFSKDIQAETLLSANGFSAQIINPADPSDTFPVASEDISLAPSPSNSAESVTIVLRGYVGLYRISVGEGVTDSHGQSLDQAPAELGSQPFSSTFRVTATDDCGGSGSTWCWNSTTEGEGACPGESSHCQNHACVLLSCDEVVCPQGFVCDPFDLSCQVDCRLYGTSPVCPTERPTCSADTGTCVE